MASITFKIKYAKHTGLAFSASELLEGFFHGIALCDDRGRVLPFTTIEDKIRAAQDLVEKTLAVKFQRQIIFEIRDFIRDEYTSWGFSKTTFPITEVLTGGFKGFLNNIEQISYPDDWISIDQTSEEYLLNRTIHLVPSGSSAEINSIVVFAGITPHLGFFGLYNIPNYWHINYCTGFTNIPAELLEFMGRLASIYIFAILGDIVLGAGIASQSLSVDGLSQSINTTQSAENSAYSARVRQYAGELKLQLPDMKLRYKGIIFEAM